MSEDCSRGVMILSFYYADIMRDIFYIVFLLFPSTDLEVIFRQQYRTSENMRGASETLCYARYYADIMREGPDAQRSFF